MVFQSLNEFRESLDEIEVLIKESARCLNEACKYSALNKSILVLLLAKFEFFLESALAEYVDKIAALELNSDLLSDDLKIYSICHVLDDTFCARLKKFNKRILLPLNKITPLLDNSKTIDSLFVNTTFNYGKHGHKQVQKMFKRIGIEDIFEECPVYENVKTLAATTKTKVNFLADINAMTGHRNFILHEDKSPSLTHQQLEIYKKRSSKFGTALINGLKKHISKIIRLKVKKNAIEKKMAQKKLKKTVKKKTTKKKAS